MDRNLEHVTGSGGRALIFEKGIADGEHTLTYKIYVEDYFGLTMYSIEARESFGGREYAACAPALTHSLDEANELADALLSEEVSAVHLLDVLEDILPIGGKEYGNFIDFARRSGKMKEKDDTKV